MFARVVSRFTYANVMSTLAVFVLLGGVSYAAATLAANSVGSRELKDNAVTSAEVKNKSLKATDFANGQLPGGPRGPAGPAGAAACEDGLLCPDTDLPNGGMAVITIDGTELTRLPAVRVDCVVGANGCGFTIAGPIGDNISLTAWFELVALGSPGQKKNFTLKVVDGAGTELRRYFVTNGYPNAYTDDGERLRAVFKADFIQRIAV